MTGPFWVLECEKHITLHKTSQRPRVALCTQSWSHRKTERLQWEGLGHPLSWDGLIPALVCSFLVPNSTIPGAAMCLGKSSWEKLWKQKVINLFLKKKKNWSYEKKLGKFCILGTLSRAWSLMDKKFWVLKKFISIFNVLLLSSFDFYNPMSLRRMNPCCSICK